MKPSKEVEPFHEAAKQLVAQFKVGFQNRLHKTDVQETDAQRQARKQREFLHNYSN